MYQPSRSRAHRAPLDFNAHVRTESVADALVSEPGLTGEFSSPAPESLLEELGLSGHVARRIAEERSGSGALE